MMNGHWVEWSEELLLSGIMSIETSNSVLMRAAKRSVCPSSCVLLSNCPIKHSQGILLQSKANSIQHLSLVVKTNGVVA